MVRDDSDRRRAHGFTTLKLLLCRRHGLPPGAAVEPAEDSRARPGRLKLVEAGSFRSPVASVGSIGNRVYTRLGDDEMYLTIPGASVGAVLGALEPTRLRTANWKSFIRADSRNN